MNEAMKVGGIKWEPLTGDVDWMEYGAAMISDKQSNGEFDYWFVIEWQSLVEYEDIAGVGGMSLEVVSPSQFADLEKACPDSEPSELSDAELVNAVRWYAGGAGITADTVECLDAGDEDDPSVKGCEKEIEAMLLSMQEAAVPVTALFGFYMDRPQNGLGSTGWDFLKGDVMAGLDRMTEARNE